MAVITPVVLFAVAFAFVESSVVVYLRSLYYPEGFSFPLRLMRPAHIGIELAREGSTIVVLAAAAVLAGRTKWERFGWFLIAFGLWDLFYYVWLRVLVCWPATLADWDILFLIPVPWIAPVAAPAAVSLLMAVSGGVMVSRLRSGRRFRPGAAAWTASLAATAFLLYSFVSDTDATLRGAQPRPYLYGALIAALLLYAAALAGSCMRLGSHTGE